MFRNTGHNHASSRQLATAKIHHCNAGSSRRSGRSSRLYTEEYIALPKKGLHDDQMHRSIRIDPSGVIFISVQLRRHAGQMGRSFEMAS